MSQKQANRSYSWAYRPLELLLLAFSSLPLRVLYLLADILYLLVAYVVGYRRKVISENLRNSFPDKSEAQIRQLTRDFYRHFSQVVVEILKLRTISATELRRRARFVNPEEIGKYLAHDRTVLTLGSHAGNWEWILSSAALEYAGRASGVYKPLGNPFFEDFMLQLRAHLGAHLVPMRDTLRALVRLRGRAQALALLSDQAAGPEDQPYWTNFLHQDTPFYTGADKLAVQFGCPVVYVGIRRVRRGYYDIMLTPIYDGDSPLDRNASFITEQFARLLERDIQAQPAAYLWSHRRWKHKRNVGL